MKRSLIRLGVASLATLVVTGATLASAPEANADHLRRYREFCQKDARGFLVCILVEEVIIHQAGETIVNAVPPPPPMPPAPPVYSDPNLNYPPGVYVPPSQCVYPGHGPYTPVYGPC